MTLVSSGDIHLIGSSGAPTRSISFELYGNYTGPRNLTTMAIAASIGSPYDITEFYGYSACSESIPGIPSGVNASWVISGVINVYFTQPGDADGIDIQRSTNGSDWVPFYSSYTGSSPFSSSTSCSYTWYRVRAYNCAGYSSYGSGVYAGPCP